MNKKIVYLTTVHKPSDVRIYQKQCKTLAARGYLVTLIAPFNEADYLWSSRESSNVAFEPLPVVTGRMSRFFLSGMRVFVAARRLNADLYHFHDPELSIIGLLLKLLGHKVVYDVHEDLPRQILSKHWINDRLKSVLAIAVESFEKIASRFFDGISVATAHIGERFQQYSPSVAVVNNYPILNELANSESWSNRTSAVCYVGGISEARGMKAIIESSSMAGVSLELAGTFFTEQEASWARHSAGWKNVNFHGHVGRDEVKNIYSTVIAGLVTLQPKDNYIDSMPIKMFEYMSAGVPVIASNFPLWQGIIEGEKCGLCVDPMDNSAISEAIIWLQRNPEEAEKMGKNGRKAVESTYNWESESEKLLDLYKRIIE